DFDDFYEKELKSKVATLEEERQKTMKLVKKQIIKLIIPIIIVIILFFFYKEIFLLSIPVIVFIGGYLFKDIKKERNELLKKIKNKPNRYTWDDLIKGYVGGNSHTTDNAGEPRTDISFSEIKADSVQIYRDKNRKKKEQVHTIFKGF